MFIMYTLDIYKDLVVIILIIMNRNTNIELKKKMIAAFYLTKTSAKCEVAMSNDLG